MYAVCTCQVWSELSPLDQKSSASFYVWYQNNGHLRTKATEQVSHTTMKKQNNYPDP